jgi:LmbE family N-acetylglucosaminyl deacetylase
MKLLRPNADIYVPDAIGLDDALARTTHLSIAAHQDDIELMAYHGVAECFGRPNRWFSGVVVTDGAGSPRSGIYEHYTDQEMRHVRVHEQRKAAYIGEYACQIQLGYPSGEVKRPPAEHVIEDLVSILEATSPEIVYLHNLADKHDTHVSVSLRALAALRRLSPSGRPGKVYGCEVWRDLDWLSDEDKQCLPVSARSNVAAALVGVFDSQVSGGKRYDLAAAGRRLANATYYASHATDNETALAFAMDLTPLVLDSALDPGEFVCSHIDKFRADVVERLARFQGT